MNVCKSVNLQSISSSMEDSFSPTIFSAVQVILLLWSFHDMLDIRITETSPDVWILVCKHNSRKASYFLNTSAWETTFYHMTHIPFHYMRTVFAKYGDIMWNGHEKSSLKVWDAQDSVCHTSEIIICMALYTACSVVKHCQQQVVEGFTLLMSCISQREAKIKQM